MFYAMRERFEGFSIKIGLLFSKFPLTPNQWTVLSVVPVLASFYYLVQEEFLLAALSFILAGFLDVVDLLLSVPWGTTCPAGFEEVAPGVPAGSFTDWKVCTFLENPGSGANIFCKTSRQ